MTYFLMITASILFAILSMKYYKKEENNITSKRLFFLFAFLSFLIPFIISAFRSYTIGTDTSGTYMEIFYRIKNGENIRDFGFGFITKVALLIFNNYTGLLILTSLIFCGLSYICIFRDSKHPAMSVLLFFTMNVFFISMNMIRQSIAISIFIYSIKYIKNRNVIKYTIAMIIAMLVHTSAILYFPMYFVYNFRINKHILCAVPIVVLFLKTFLLDFIINILIKIEYFNKYFSWYLTSQYNTGELNVVSFLIACCILIFLILIYKSAREDKEYNMLLWNEIIAITFLAISSELPLMQRTSFLFTFPLYIYLPNMFKYIKNFKLRLSMEILVNMGYFAYMIVTTFVFAYNEVYPYKWII